MYPEIIKIGPITIHSFGLMMALAFLTAMIIFKRELIRKNLNPEADSEILLSAAIGGVLGAKIYHLFQYFDEVLADPVGMIFSGAGLVWYGGLVGATILITLMIRLKKYPTFKMYDAIVPGLALAYGIGRIGCFLAGDGDYGPPTNLPWGMSFPDGIVPTSVKVHPTPIYEMMASVLIFYILWIYRKKVWRDGSLFGLYLALAGFERFFIEFWRINPVVGMGLSMAQWLSFLLIPIGIFLMLFRNKGVSFLRTS